MPSSRDPVISPAPELPAPAAAASIGRTDSSRKKLVSEVNSARNVRPSGRLISRAGAPSPAAGRACAGVLIARTLTPAAGVGWVIAPRRPLRPVRAAAQVRPGPPR